MFNLLSNETKSFDLSDIERVLKLLDMKLSKQEMHLMVWEVDEKLDKRIRYSELLNMYKKCIMDKVGLEPKSLFHMIQFLMYCKAGLYTITVEHSLELIYVRTGKEHFEEEIEAIFGSEDKIIDGKEKEMDFKEYLDKINKRVIQYRKDRAKEKQDKYKNSPMIKKGE